MLLNNRMAMFYFHIKNFNFLTMSRNCSQVVPTVLKPATTLYKKTRIVDKVRIYVRGGSGGQGCLSAGGIGGTGGSVLVKCMKGASLRLYLQKHNRRIIAEHGEQYKKGKINVKPARNAFIVVPPGTEVKSANGVLIADLNKEEDIIKVVSGGAGGSAKTSDFNGRKGERRNIVLELKTIADAALTGFPNAGKSSLLRLLSRARPKVGDYPFTTISPMVGSIFYTDGSQVSVADLPGLIEDAHLNKGMGHRFLRHIERTKVILLVVDINGFQLKSTHSYHSPLDTIILLLKELFLYQDLFLERPVYLVLNKMDTEASKGKKEQLFAELSNIRSNHALLDGQNYGDDILRTLKQLSENDFESVFPISAVSGYGVEKLKECLYHNVPRTTSEDVVDEYVD